MALWQQGQILSRENSSNDETCAQGRILRREKSSSDETCAQGRILRREKSSSDEACAPCKRKPSSKYETLARVQELVDVFKRFDANGDGLISACELGAVLRSLGCNPSQRELARMIRNVDSNGDGYISLYEFIEMNMENRDRDVDVDVQMLKNAFKLFDLDNSGRISATELHTVLKSLGEESTLQDCRDMILSVDYDGDGLISFDEFKLFMKNA